MLLIIDVAADDDIDAAFFAITPLLMLSSFYFHYDAFRFRRLFHCCLPALIFFRLRLRFHIFAAIIDYADIDIYVYAFAIIIIFRFSFCHTAPRRHIFRLRHYAFRHITRLIALR